MDQWFHSTRYGVRKKIQGIRRQHLMGRAESSVPSNPSADDRLPENTTRGSATTYETMQSSRSHEKPGDKTSESPVGLMSDRRVSKVDHTPEAQGTAARASISQVTNRTQCILRKPLSNATEMDKSTLLQFMLANITDAFALHLVALGTRPASHHLPACIKAPDSAFNSRVVELQTSHLGYPPSYRDRESPVQHSNLQPAT